MIQNLRYVFRYDRKGIHRAFFWEWLHGTLIALPGGLLLIVLWELFEPEPQFEIVWTVVGVMLGLFLLQLVVANRAMLSSNDTTFEISRRLRLALGNKLQRLSLGYYKKRDPGDLAAVALQDVANFENIFGHSVANIANAIVGTFSLAVFLLWLDWRLTLLLLSALGIAFPLIYLSRWLVERYGQTHIQSRNRTGARFLEYILGIQPIKAFGLTGSRFKTLDRELLLLRNNSIKVEAVPGPFVMLAGVAFEFGFLAMISWAVYRLSGGLLEVKLLIAFLILGYRLYEPLKILMVEYPVLSYMNISLRRIIEVLEAQEPPVGKDLRPEHYDLAFQQVGFGYNDDRQILSGIDFQAKAGTMTALVGPSGSGKTTIISLIARFWDVDEGSVSIGGIDLRNMDPRTVHALVSEVFQDVYLFNDTVYNNILMGRPEATEAEVLEVARQAQVLAFAEDLPEGLQTLVGEGGNQLSGGQKQRISIARALLKDAPIVLVDEATAALDPENEVYIQAALQALVQKKTVIIIAHKLATVQQADTILVLDQGKVVERGNHENLLVQQGLYARLWTAQQRAKGWKFKPEPAA